jgi:2,3-bisphosphoglycerate-dependent phosphoglycerate mutase
MPGKANNNRNAVPSRRKRRRSRLFAIFGYVLVAIGLAWFFESQATTTIIFVRHADTDASMAAGGDPPLNDVGHRRAELLADVIQDIDVVAGVDAIYASKFRRTQQTAAPLAKRLGLEVNVADPYDVEAFMAQVLHDHKGQVVLVVTHSDVLAQLVAELHGSKKIPPIAKDEYDNIYVVSIPWFGKVKTLRLHYGLPWHGDALSSPQLSGYR